MSDYYCRCETCKYADPSKRDHSWRWYCNWYGTFEDVEIVRECRHYKER